MRYFLPRGLLLILALLASVLLPIGGNLGPTISSRQGTTVLATPAVQVLNEADAETVTFSSTAFPRERAEVRRLYADEINRSNHYQSPSVETDIVVAVVDLSSNGRKGVLAFLQSPYFCERLGCRFVLLIATLDSRWKIGLDTVWPGAVRVSRHMTNGLRDILLERRVGSYAAFRWDGRQYQWSGTVIQPEQTLPERKWSDTDRQRLRAYLNTYASEEALWDPAVRARLQRLLGPVELDNLEDHLETRVPIGQVDGVLFVKGNVPHFASDRRGLLAINLQTGSVYAGISTEDYIRIYIGDERILLLRSTSGMRSVFTLLPVIVQEWALDTKCPCLKPDNVELRFGPP